jgi:hypothetical protein
MPVNKSGQFYRDYDIDLSKEQKSKAPVKTVPTPTVKGNVVKDRGDLMGVGSGRGTGLSKESPIRVQGNLIKSGRGDTSKTDEDADDRGKAKY